jgi:hypothetical protein
MPFRYGEISLSWIESADADEQKIKNCFNQRRVCHRVEAQVIWRD